MGEVLVTPEDTPTARGLLTPRLTMVDSAMPVTEVLVTPEDTPTARGLLTPRLTMVDSAMPALEVSVMVMVLVLATAMQLKCPRLEQGSATKGIAKPKLYKKFHRSD